MSQSTPYTETEFLLAVMEERFTDAAHIISNMLPNERRKLKVQLREGAELIEGFEDIMEKGDALPDPEAQAEYDDSPELRKLLGHASESSTVNKTRERS